MHVLNIRNINDTIYKSIKEESKKKGTSINKLILGILDRVFHKEKKVEYHDLDDFFGTWSDEDYNTVMEVSGEMRTIDDELWK